jgi:hypothetical protein
LVLFAAASSLPSCTVFRSVAGKKKKKDATSAVVDSTKMATRPDSLSRTETVVQVKAPENVKSQEETKLMHDLQPVWAKRIDYATFFGKAKIHFEGPDGGKDFTAHIRMRKDSVIWVNITALGGISFARIFITPDSFFMINMVQKEAIKIPLSQAAKVLPTTVDFASLQNLVVGNPLHDGRITGARAGAASWLLNVEDTSYLQTIELSMTDSTMLSEKLATHRPDAPQADEKYTGYEAVDGRRVSTGRVINIQNGADAYLLEMDFQKVEFDRPQEYRFSIPENYKVK